MSRKTLIIFENIFETDETCVDTFRDLSGFENLISAIQKFRERIEPPSTGKEEMEISSTASSPQFDKKYLKTALRLANLSHEGTSALSIMDSPLASLLLDIFSKPSFYGGAIYYEGSNQIFFY